MGRRPRKTDPCPCGSGKKYKYCHGAPVIEAEAAPPRRTAFVITVAVLTPIVLGLGLLQATSTPPEEPAPDVAPAGQVWSEAHGHWHDDPAAGAASDADIHVVDETFQPAYELQPPAGAAPPDKVWSDEHGHWHEGP